MLEMTLFCTQQHTSIARKLAPGTAALFFVFVLCMVMLQRKNGQFHDHILLDLASYRKDENGGAASVFPFEDTVAKINDTRRLTADAPFRAAVKHYRYQGRIPGRFSNNPDAKTYIASAEHFSRLVLSLQDFLQNAVLNYTGVVLDVCPTEPHSGIRACR